MLGFTSLNRNALLASTLSLTVGVVCIGTSTTAFSEPTTGRLVAQSGKVSLTGAGASFPAPLYQRWFSDYNKKNPNTQVSYQSVGSGAGVEQFIKGTVDFGASDVAMKDEEMAKVSKGAILLPMTAGSIVLGYNLPGVTDLKLSRKNYVDIFQGKITKWNDPALAKDNPGVKLPDMPISVITRSDGSGTTGVFTKHLSAINPDWKSKVGEGKTVQWPTGTAAKGNEGVTAQILQTEGGIGYIEYGYAKQQNISMASLENKAGKFVQPNEASASKSLAAVELPTNLRAFISDPEGPESYPIVTYSWILAYKKYDNPQKAEALKSVLNWSLEDGQKLADQLGYIPLPANVVEKVKQAVNTIQ